MARLSDIVEPLFHEVCRVNRAARKGGSVPVDRIRSALVGELDRCVREADAAGLGNRYREVEPALIALCDEVVIESGMLGPGEWRPIGEERGIETGVVYALVERKLSEDADADTLEQLRVLYTVFGLGYTGEKAGDSESLRAVMGDLSSKLRGLMDSDRRAAIVPEAYEHLDTSDLIQPPGRSVVGLGLVLLAMTLVVIGGNAYFYWDAGRQLSGSLDEIETQAERAVPREDAE